jgi:hypothetical protein
MAMEAIVVLLSAATFHNVLTTMKTTFFIDTTKQEHMFE